MAATIQLAPPPNKQLLIEPAAIGHCETSVPAKTRTTSPDPRADWKHNSLALGMYHRRRRNPLRLCTFAIATIRPRGCRTREAV